MLKAFVTLVCLNAILGFFFIVRAEQKAQTRPHEPEAPYTLEVDVNLVNINVVVTNAAGNYMLDLKKDDFQIYEDKVEQKITLFFD